MKIALFKQENKPKKSLFADLQRSLWICHLEEEEKPNDYRV